MGEIGAIGDAIAGAVLGRAVEPNAGEADGHTHQGNCLNCGAPLIGPDCNQCGQHSHVHRTLGAFFHDFVLGPGLARQIREGRPQTLRRRLVVVGWLNFALTLTVPVLGTVLAHLG